MVVYDAKQSSGTSGAAASFDLYNVQQGEFWKQKTMKEDAVPLETAPLFYRNATPVDTTRVGEWRPRRAAPWTAGLRPTSTGLPLGKRWPAPPSNVQRRAFRSHSAPRAVFGRGRGHKGRANDSGYTSHVKPTSTRPKSALTKMEQEYDFDHDGHLDHTELAILGAREGRLDGAGSRGHAQSAQTAAVEVHADLEDEMMVSGSAALSSRPAPRSPAPRSLAPPVRKFRPHTARMARVQAARAPAAPRPSSARAPVTGMSEVERVRSPMAGIDRRPAHNHKLIDMQTAIHVPHLAEDHLKYPEAQRKAELKSMNARCEMCADSNRSTTATFGLNGEKCARWCGVCAVRSGAGAQLVRILCCVGCNTPFSWLSRNRPPHKHDALTYCTICAVGAAGYDAGFNMVVTTSAGFKHPARAAWTSSVAGGGQVNAAGVVEDEASTFEAVHKVGFTESDLRDSNRTDYAKVTKVRRNDLGIFWNEGTGTAAQKREMAKAPRGPEKLQSISQSIFSAQEPGPPARSNWAQKVQLSQQKRRR